MQGSLMLVHPDKHKKLYSIQAVTHSGLLLLIAKIVDSGTRNLTARVLPLFQT
jgi:hypothetical protein